MCIFMWIREECNQDPWQWETFKRYCRSQVDRIWKVRYRKLTNSTGISDRVRVNGDTFVQNSRQKAMD